MSISYVCSKCGKPLAIIHGELVCPNCIANEKETPSQIIQIKK